MPRKTVPASYPLSRPLGHPTSTVSAADAGQWASRYLAAESPLTGPRFPCFYSISIGGQQK